jgi:uncharacterized membrane protein
VLGSPWAVLLGVPVAIHGMVYFFLALVCAWLGKVYLKSDFRTSRDVVMMNVLCTGTGVVSVLYFILLEFHLGALCPLCTVVHGLVLASFYVALRIQKDQGYKGLWTVGVVSEMLMFRSGLVLLAMVIAFLPVVFFALPAIQPAYETNDVVALAKCLKERNVVMYGAKGCSHCIAQKALFGKEAFGFMSYVDCVDAENEETCKDHQIEGYPTFLKNGANARLQGQTSLLKLSEWAGCFLSKKG